MATIDQIEKQIASSNKKIDSIVKRVDMYRLRLQKAILAINKAGASLEVEDIEMVETRRGGYVLREFRLPAGMMETYGFEACYKVTFNRESLDEAERLLGRERRHRDSLSEELACLKANTTAKEKEDSHLMASLEKAMSDFREVWFERMREWYRSHHARIGERLPLAKGRYERAKACMAYFTHRRGTLAFRRSRLFPLLTGIERKAAEIIGDEAARMDLTTYMAKKEEELIASWERGLELLTSKCRKFGLDETAIRVDAPLMTDKGFSAFITDGGASLVDVRVIWAAEYSLVITPHTRYIATQRRLPSS